MSTPSVTAKTLALSVSRMSPFASWIRRCASGPRARSVLGVIQDAAVLPLMGAEPFRDCQRVQRDCRGHAIVRGDFNGDLDGAPEWPGRYPQAARRAGGQVLCDQVTSGWRERPSEHLPDAGFQAGKVLFEVPAVPGWRPAAR